MSDVLVYVPMARLYGRALQTILRLEWPGRLDIVFDKGNDAPEGAGRGHKFDVVTAKYVHGRNLALAGSYQAMLCVEDDMIVPPDALMKLWEADADIAYGLYCWRNQSFHKWSAYTELSDDHGVSLSDDPAEARRLWGQVVEVQGIGMGCTLIRRRVLEALPFRRHGVACCDWGLALDARAAGFRQVCDLSVVCGHMTADNDQSCFPIRYGVSGPPRIIWPDPDLDGIGRMYRVEYL